MPVNAGDVRDAGLIPESGRSPGEGNDNPLQNSCLENPMDSGGWQAAVHRITESWMWLKWLSTHRKHQIPQRGKLLSLFELLPSSILASHWVPACDVLAAACQVASVVSDSVRPLDCSLPDFSVHGILQARTLEWVAISFSNAWKWKVKVKSLSRVWLLATPWTAAYQAPPSMGFSRQQYWSGVPLPSPVMS